MILRHPVLIRQCMANVADNSDAFQDQQELKCFLDFDIKLRPY